MTISEALAEMLSGKRVVCNGMVFWLTTNDKGCPILMGHPPALAKPVKHVVISSEHFMHNWELE